MDKQTLRERIWDELEDSGEARFPYPPHDRIPNFAGAGDAAARLTETDEWESADRIKSNPDAPQLPVRRAALREGKTVCMAVPRLRDERCFLRLDPAELEDTDAAATIGGASDAGEPVHPEEMAPIDLIVSGSVAVTEQGVRIGKGEGYSDLEFAILRAFDLVDDGTTTVSTVHELQVVDEQREPGDHDVPIDWIVTPERVVHTSAPPQKPNGIVWDELSEERIEAIPILGHLR